MSVTRVLVDANVLYSRTLRDWLAILFLCSKGNVYSVHWTEDILAEVIGRLRRKNPDWSGRRTAAIRDAIADTFEGGRVDDFTIDGSFRGTDVNDRHVHAAALACRADILLSDDNGFAAGEVGRERLPYEVYVADDFFVLVDDAAPECVAEATRQQTGYWYEKTGRAPLAAQLERSGCPTFARRVRQHQCQLSLPELR